MNNKEKFWKELSFLEIEDRQTALDLVYKKISPNDIRGHLYEEEVIWTALQVQNILETVSELEKFEIFENMKNRISFLIKPRKERLILEKKGKRNIKKIIEKVLSEDGVDMKHIQLAHYIGTGQYDFYDMEDIIEVDSGIKNSIFNLAEKFKNYHEKGFSYLLQSRESFIPEEFISLNVLLEEVMNAYSFDIESQIQLNKLMNSDVQNGKLKIGIDQGDGFLYVPFNLDEDFFSQPKWKKIGTLKRLLLGSKPILAKSCGFSPEKLKIFFEGEGEFPIEESDDGMVS